MLHRMEAQYAKLVHFKWCGNKNKNYFSANNVIYCVFG